MQSWLKPYMLMLSKMTNLDSSKLKEFADGNFKFDTQKVENTVGKGEIARHERCFQKICTADT